jgi:hypothetical protein
VSTARPAKRPLQNSLLGPDPTNAARDITTKAAAVACPQSMVLNGNKSVPP